MSARIEYAIEGRCDHCGTQSEIGVAYAVTETEAKEVFLRFHPEYSHLTLEAFAVGASAGGLSQGESPNQDSGR